MLTTRWPSRLKCASKILRRTRADEGPRTAISAGFVSVAPGFGVVTSKGGTRTSGSRTCSPPSGRPNAPALEITSVPGWTYETPISGIEKENVPGQPVPHDADVEPDPSSCPDASSRRSVSPASNTSATPDTVNGALTRPPGCGLATVIGGPR